MTMPQLDTEGFGLLKGDDSAAAQKELCSCGEPLSSAPSPAPGPSYIVKFTIDYTALMLVVILIILM